LTHGPAMGTLDYVPHSNKHAGCEELQTRLAALRASIHAFGHIHESLGFETMRWDAGVETLAINASVCDLKHQAVNPAIVVDIERTGDRTRPRVSVVKTK